MIDYRLWLKKSTENDYVVYEENIQYVPYTITGLTPGVTYNIKVQARNIVNYGLLSNELSVLAA